MTSFLVKANVLAALRLFAAKGKPEHLSGIFLEAGPKGCRLVATDGIILGIARIDDISPDPVRVFLPHHILANVEKDSGLAAIAVGESLHPDTRQVTITCGRSSVQSEVPAAGCPSYSNALQNRASGEAAHFDPKRIATLEKAQKILCGPKTSRPPIIAQNGEGAALVWFDVDDFFAALMPMRVKIPKEKLSSPPEWTTAPLE